MKTKNKYKKYTLKDLKAMMKKTLPIIIFLFLICMNTVCSQDNPKRPVRNLYEKEWKEADDYIAKSLPASAIKTATNILDKALAENNIPQVVKAHVYIHQQNQRIDYQYASQLVPELEKLTEKAQYDTDKALVHTILAEMYLNYFNSDRWNIQGRTNLPDDIIPNDINEWTSNTFLNRICKHIDAAKNLKEALLKDETKSYEDIIDLKVDSRTYQPTLYDFVMNRLIETAKNIKEVNFEEFDISSTGQPLDKLLLPASEFTKLELKPIQMYIALNLYQEYLANLQDRKLSGEAVLIEMNKFNFLKRWAQQLDNKKQLDVLQNLQKAYKDEPTSVEIILEIANLYPALSYYNPNGSEVSNETKDANQKAYDWLQKGLKDFSKYKRINILNNKITQMESPSMIVNGNNTFYKDDNIELELYYKNSQAIKEPNRLLLYRVEGDKETLVRTIAADFSSEQTYNFDKVTLTIGQLPYGEYCLKNNFEKEDSSNNFTFYVTDLLTYYRCSEKNKFQIFVVDRLNGKPVPNAKITVFKYKLDKDGRQTKKRALLTTLKTNGMGEAVYRHKVDEKDNYYYYDNNYAFYSVEADKDDGLKVQGLENGYFRDYQSSSGYTASTATSIFTDRSIYRPGQTVYFKAIVLNQQSHVVPKSTEKIVLRDPNYEIVGEQNITTNEFGAISGSFVLPQGKLLGNYRIEMQGQAANIKVEEYKRPTFEVKFDKVDKTYRFGEKITLKGNAKTYSGLSLQDAKVNYSITRNPFAYWFGQGAGSSFFINGEVKTKEDGSFEIEFVPEAGDGHKFYNRNIYTFNIVASITDTNGETQTGVHNMTIGDVSMYIYADIPKQIAKSEDLKINIAAKNLSDMPIETSGKYVIHTVDKNDSIQTQVLDGDFKTGTQIELATRIKGLKSGKYRIEITAKDDNDKEVSSTNDFVLFSYDDKKPPYGTNVWFVVKDAYFKDGKPAEIVYGTSNKDAYILYQVYNNKKTFESKFIKLSEESRLFTIPYLNDYGKGVYVSFTAVTNGVLTTSSQYLNKIEKSEDFSLKVKTTVFRDKLRPGDEETWAIQILDSQDKPAEAEVLASMYDKSLNQIMQSASWYLNRVYKYTEYVEEWNYRYQSPGKESYRPTIPNNSDYWSVPSFLFDSFRNNLEYYFRSRAYSSMRMRGVASRNEELVLDEVVVASPLASQTAATGMVSNTSSMKKMTAKIVAEEEMMIPEPASPVPPSTVEIRKNFNETAFFYPYLRTNEVGETLITFTVPDSNTKWIFRALAHDKNGKTGYVEQETTTQKELMVTPNMPRFLRQGDITSISTKISNLSDEAIKGDVHIEFFNPIDEKPINLKLKEEKQKFEIEKDASTSVSWSFEVPADMDMIGIKIIAANHTFSDGEQHALAILPNRMLVTETMPFDITQTGKETFVFDKLANTKSKSLDNYRLTLEFTSNPAWYAIQAMPTMSSPTSDDAISWFSSYYTNSLGASLMKSYPKIANTIDAWTKLESNKDVLVSKLYKNEELKTILQEETPWVMDAKSETEQMSRLSLLLDLNNSKQLTNEALKKLQKLQMNNGAWSWYEGLYPSRSITQYILYGFANLKETGGIDYTPTVQSMIDQGIVFVDQEIANDLKRLKEYNPKTWKDISSISSSQLEYLYIRTLHKDIQFRNNDAKEAETFYYGVVSKNWTHLSLYNKALLAIIAKRKGDEGLAREIVKSIKEHAVVNKELGMYWPNNNNSVFLSMSAISAHTFMMKALQENGATVEETDMLKRWLVKQKQTQIWETTNATINAISALVQQGTNWFDSTTEPTIKVGNTTIEPSHKDLGTGYYKTSWDKNDIKNDMAKVTVNSADSKPAYGALYWQYYEDLDKITKQGGSLNVTKELYKETVTKDGRSLVKITEKDPLKIGDKVIVRLVVRADRDMEFVQLKDMRAACFEPIQTRSGIAWQNSMIYYTTSKDASTNFFFDVLPKGTYVFEYPVYANRSGQYSNGITSIQCAYAPEFTAHTSGIRVTVEE